MRISTNIFLVHQYVHKSMYHMWLYGSPTIVTTVLVGPSFRRGHFGRQKGYLPISMCICAFWLLHSNYCEKSWVPCPMQLKSLFYVVYHNIWNYRNQNPLSFLKTRKQNVQKTPYYVPFQDGWSFFDEINCDLSYYTWCTYTKTHAGTTNP